MEKNELLWEFQREIVKIYEIEGLTNLRGLHNEYKINGKELLAWYLDVVHKNQIEHPNFDYFKNLNDILFCSDELLYFTANLYLYRPFINNPIKDGFFSSGKMVYPNYQNMESSRYSMFADVAAQKVYNYWGRIAELINSFFPGILEPVRVNFAAVIDAIPAMYHINEHYLWLKEFKTVDYKKMNGIRRQIVHYTTLETSFNQAHLKSSDDKLEMGNLIENRDKWADFYKEHLNLSIIGFEKALLFLEYVSKEIFIDSK